MNTHHRTNGCPRLGDKVTGEWRNLNGDRIAIEGTLVSGSGGFVTIALDHPVEFAPGRPRNEVSFTRDEHHCWRTVADGPALDWADVCGSFGDQALTASGLAKCGVVRER